MLEKKPSHRGAPTTRVAARDCGRTTRRTVPAHCSMRTATASWATSGAAPAWTGRAAAHLPPGEVIGPHELFSKSALPTPPMGPSLRGGEAFCSFASHCFQWDHPLDEKKANPKPIPAYFGIFTQIILLPWEVVTLGPKPVAFPGEAVLLKHKFCAILRPYKATMASEICPKK